jgi:predicted ATP-grasp superfamily ATP-dependent carboligase
MTESDHVRWLSNPQLQTPAVIAGFSGWNDAADAASSAVRTLIDAWNAEPLAEIDPEDFTDFATIRPMVKLEDGIHRSIVWPKVSLWHASTPGTDVILVLGPEPSLKWRLFTEQIVSIAAKYNSSMVLTLGALLADVVHSRDVRVMGTSNDQSTLDRFELQRSTYEGPTGIIGVLQDACTQSSIPSASLWAAVPAYASQIPSPKAASALIARAGEIIGTPAPLSALHNSIVAYDRRVEELVEDDEDLREYVDRLDSMGDDAFNIENPNQLEFEFGENEDEVDEEDANSLVDEVEQFLRDQDSN